VPAEPFAVVLEPAAEMRSQRAKRIIVGQIKAEHAERDHGANLELDAEGFRARAFIVMAAEALGRAPIPGLGTGRRDDEVNTHVATAAGKLDALVEAGNLPVELAADGLDPGGDLARRGPPPSGLRQVGDIAVLRGSAAASCLAMSNHWCPPRGRSTRRSAA
jgi:hypothetical protein